MIALYSLMIVVSRAWFEHATYGLGNPSMIPPLWPLVANKRLSVNALLVRESAEKSERNRNVRL